MSTLPLNAGVIGGLCDTLANNKDSVYCAGNNNEPLPIALSVRSVDIFTWLVVAHLSLP